MEKLCAINQSWAKLNEVSEMRKFGFYLHVDCYDAVTNLPSSGDIRFEVWVFGSYPLYPPHEVIVPIIACLPCGKGGGGGIRYVTTKVGGVRP